MTDKKENGWIKFVPSLDLPKERVSIAYDTHDERGIRYAYGYFQFYNGTCGCFWKDGNEQPKVVKAEDIKYWMPVPSLDVQEEPVSEDFKEFEVEYFEHEKDNIVCVYDRHAGLVDGAQWQKEQIMAKAVDVTIAIPYPNGYGGYTQLLDSKEGLPFGENLKVLIIKQE